MKNKIKELGNMYKDKYGVIYLITNILNNKKYVGQTVNFKKRMSIYLTNSSSTRISSIMHKIGFNNFDIEIIDYADNSTDLDTLEKKWIKELDTINNGYNIMSGGSGNTLESRYNRSKAHKGMKASAKTKKIKSNKIYAIKINNDLEIEEVIFCDGAKLFADFLEDNVKRTHVTRAIKHHLILKNYVIRYKNYDEYMEIYKDLCDNIDNTKSKKKLNILKKIKCVYDKFDSIDIMRIKRIKYQDEDIV